MPKIAVLRKSLGVVLFVAGALLWSTRLPPELGLERYFRASELHPKPVRTGDFIHRCPGPERPDKWTIFFVRAVVIADNGDRGYLETDDSDQGLVLRYVPNHRMYASALILEVPSPAGATDFLVRTVRKTGEVEIVIGLSNESLRVMSNGVDRTFRLPPQLKLDMSCGAFGVGVADDLSCNECEVSAWYLSDLATREVAEVFGSISNERDSKLKSFTGMTLALLSLLVLFGKGARPRPPFRSEPRRDSSRTLD